jgi:nucleoside-diphosphate-sugar epimerase
MSSPVKTVLITGATGFLGRHCVEKFIKENFKVITTDKAVGADLTGDLCDPEFVRSLPNVDIIVNCAAVQYVTKKKPLLRRKAFFLNNSISSKLLSNRYSSNTHFIQIGSSMMYRMSDKDLIETDQLKGNGIYSNSKCDAQVHIENIPFSATVIPCIIGGRGREGLFRVFVKMIALLPFVILLGDGTKPIHMVHVEDVAELIILIAKKRTSGIFNAASIDPLSINAWIVVIATQLKKKPPKLIHLPIMPLRILSLMTGYRLLAREQILMLENRHVLCITKSRQIGWEPMYTNAEIAQEITTHIIQG